jgi:hypothetical protein
LSEATGQLRGLTYHFGGIVLPGGGLRGATAYPQGPTRGRTVSYYPIGPA